MNPSRTRKPAARTAGKTSKIVRKSASGIRSARGASDPAAHAGAADVAQPGRRLDPEVGARIRELRRVKGLTIPQLAEQAGVSVGYISQVERNRSRLPIAMLKRLADVLGVHMNWFFEAGVAGPEHERGYVVRAANRRSMSFTGSGIREELLSPGLAGPLELLLSTLEPGADSEFYSHDGCEAGLVLSGQLQLWVEDREFLLKAGDSFSFRSTESHRCRNPGRLPTRVVWVITPPHY